MSQKEKKKTIFRALIFSGNSSLPLHFPRCWLTNLVSFVFQAPGQGTEKYLEMRGEFPQFSPQAYLFQLLLELLNFELLLSIDLELKTPGDKAKGKLALTSCYN